MNYENKIDRGKQEQSMWKSTVKNSEKYGP